MSIAAIAGASYLVDCGSYDDHRHDTSADDTWDASGSDKDAGGDADANVGESDAGDNENDAGSNTDGGINEEFIKVWGDTPCPIDFSLTTPNEALANQDDICLLLGPWDIARLAGGGSMDGPGYGCGIRVEDTRSLGATVCKTPMEFTRGTGDGICPEGYTVASPVVVQADLAAACSVLGAGDIARLAGGASMSGPDADCAISEKDDRQLDSTVCAMLYFMEAQGDTPCPLGWNLVSPATARAKKDAICSKLDTWDVVRLEGGGSMDGPGYGCGVRDEDTRSLGHSLCAKPIAAEPPPDPPQGSPTVTSVPYSEHPASVPVEMAVVCMTGPNSPIPDGESATCPVVKWGGLTYWAFSYFDNRDSMGIVGYDKAGNIVSQVEKVGARYVWKATVDGNTVTFWGQANATVVFP